MGAGVKQDADHIVVAAHQDHRAAGNISRAIVARMGHFGFMTDVDPALLKDAPPFLLQTLRVGKHPPVDSKQARRLVIDDVIFGRSIHDESPCARSHFFARRIPCPVLRDRAAIDPQVHPGNHPGVFRSEENRSPRVITRAR